MVANSEITDMRQLLDDLSLADINIDYFMDRLLSSTGCYRFLNHPPDTEFRRISHYGTVIDFDAAVRVVKQFFTAEELRVLKAVDWQQYGPMYGLIDIVVQRVVV